MIKLIRKYIETLRWFMRYGGHWPKKIRLFKAFDVVSERQRCYNLRRIEKALEVSNPRYLQAFYSLNHDCSFLQTYLPHLGGDALAKWNKGKELYDLWIRKVAYAMAVPLRQPLDYVSIGRRLLVTEKVQPNDLP